MKRFSTLLFIGVMIMSQLYAQFNFPGMDSIRKYSDLDHKKMMELLKIDSLRPGRNGFDTTSPYYANYNESKANPYPNLPDPLILKNGKKVTNADMWWKLRRPEIVEDFDREIYGRIPPNSPKVNWEVVSTTKGTHPARTGRCF